MAVASAKRLPALDRDYQAPRGCLWRNGYRRSPLGRYFMQVSGLLTAFALGEQGSPRRVRDW